MKKILVIVIVLSFSVSGCFWPFTGSAKRLAVATDSDGVSIEVLNPEAIKKGGKLYAMPFSPGAEAAATDAFDHLALLMVKGISDALADGVAFTLVSGEEAGAADFVIKGHIEQYQVRGSLKKTAVIKVRGDLRTAGSDQVIALIYAERHFANPVKRADQVAYDIGHAIAMKLSQ